MSSSNLGKIDFTHLWHPFTQEHVWREQEPLIIERAAGHELFDTNGKRYLDGISSLWCNVHGHGEPSLLRALHEQTDRLCHSTLLGLSHRPILELSEKLVTFLPAALHRLFYAESGSTAVEAALRIALEWQQKQGSPSAKKKTKFLSLHGAYHGDTLGSVGVGYLEDFHHSLRLNLCQALRVRPPHFFRFEERLTPADAQVQSISELRQTFRKYSSELAAMIIEPLVQGAAGIWIHSPEFLQQVAALCAEHEVLLIVDEVATGFGKTGSMFAIQQAGIVPDILVLGKGLSGGYLPLSATAVTDRIYSAFAGKPSEGKTFFFGTTFCGNPLAAAVAVANLRLCEGAQFLDNITEGTTLLQQELQAQISTLSHVDEIRQCGMMVGIEFTAEPLKRVPFPADALVGQRITLAARRHGLIIRPLGNVMVLMPAVSMTAQDLRKVVQLTRTAIIEVLGE